MTEKIRWDEDIDGPLSQDSMRRKFEALGYGSSVYVYSPGTVFPNHTHSVAKMDGVVSGCFRITTDDCVFDLQAGDTIAIPAGQVHRAEVIGNEPVVSVDGVRKK